MAIPIVELHRTRERQHTSVPSRVERLEEDADRLEYQILDVAQSHVATKASVDSLKNRATALAISFTGASALLVINLVVSLKKG